MLALRTAALLAVLILSCTVLPPHTRDMAPAASVSATSIAVGTQEGDFSVNANGAATYTMDLEVPPGTQGVQPRLAVWYVSQDGDGLLGYGFTLQGLSSITRCQASLKLDGYNGGIGYDANDRFCLDGQRLVKISGSGDYGAAGSVYSTENQTWTKVTAVGTCGTGPCSFTALNKDGWALDFGTGDSGVALPGAKELAAWQIESSTDLNGNRISVSYRYDSSTLQNLPSEILYTENENAGIAATRRVTFDYEPRSQQIPRYSGGYRFTLKDRLAKIRTSLDGQAVLEYSLTYKTSSGTRRDLLASIQKCTAAGQCFPSTTFTWQEETNTLTSPTGSSAGILRNDWCTEANALIGWSDFNGDGTPDLHCDTSDGTHSVLVSNGTTVTGTSRSDGVIRTGWCAGTGFTPSWIDFNGDAKSDLACDGTDGSHRVLLSNGVSLSGVGSYDGLLKTGWCGGSSTAEWGNFNGDGRADLLCRSSDGYHEVLISTGTGFTTPNKSTDARVVSSPWCTAAGALMFWADFNGDTMADAYCANPSGVQQVLVSNGSSLTTPNTDVTGIVNRSWCAGGRVGVADLNGDGLSDSTCDSGDGTYSAQLSTGRTLVTPNQSSTGLLSAPRSWCTGTGALSAWSDFNGDGLSDLQCRDSDDQLLILLSTGTDVRTIGTSAEGVVRSDWCDAATGRPDWIDFNADALGDIACSTSGTQQVFVHTAGAPDLVSKITDGIGMTVSLTYAALTDATIYTPGTRATYPTLDIRSPLYVVSRYVIGDGRNAQYAFQYQYKGARTDIEEHRWMGFEEVSFTQTAIGRKVVTTYAQEYPLIAFVTSVTTVDSSGRTLASTAYTPLVRQPYGNVYDVLVASETSSTYTNGVVDYTQVRNYDYDDYGNPMYISDVSSPYFELYTCAKFRNATDTWRLGYRTEQKTTRTAQSCRDFLGATTPAWNAATDLRWSRTEYDSRMNVTAESAWDDVNGAFITVSRTFNAAGGVSIETDAGGNVTTWTWDDTVTYPATLVSPPVAGGRQLTTRFTFHRTSGELASITDPNGNVRSVQVDGFGRRTAVLGPDPSSSSGDATVALQTFAYAQDATGRYVESRQRQTWADGDTGNWFYLRDYQDGLSRTFLRRQRSVRAGVDVLTETQFDSAGREWKNAIPHYSDANADYTVTSYDFLDRPVTITQPDNTITKIEYLKGITQVRTTEAYGTNIARTTTNANDLRALNLSNTAANGGLTTTTYDPVGQPLTTMYPTGRTTVTTWDSLGRPVKNVDSDSGTSTWTWGTDGLLQSITNGAGAVVSFAYDSLNRPTRRTLTSAGSTSQVYTFDYDDAAVANGLGNLTAVTGPDYREDYAYSRYLLVATERLTLDGNVYVDQADHDPVMRVSSRKFPDGSQLRTTWNVDGTLEAQDLQESGGTFVNYATYTSYDALRQPLTLLLGNGLRTDETYYSLKEAMARPKSLSVARQSAPSSPLLTRAYTWDQLAALTSVQNMRSGESTQSESYGYDEMGWLKTANGPYGELAWNYDLAGNITEQNGTTYRYTSSSDRLSASGDGSSFAYDGAGNMSGKTNGLSRWQYQHDASSRLATVLLNDLVVAAHLYDSDDQRIRRTDATGTVSIYVSSDVDVVQSGNSILLTKTIQGVNGPLAAVTTAYTPQALARVLEQQKTQLEPDRYSKRSLRGIASWIVASANANRSLIAFLAIAVSLVIAVFLIRRANYARRHPVFSSWIPFLIFGLLFTSADVRADLGAGDGFPTPVTLYFHGDQVDSTVLVTDSDGNETTRIAYEPFGRIDEARSAGPDNFRPKFTTKERDHGSGLDYFGARYYDSSLGRFLEPDPQAQFASAYVYGGNDPLNMIDPDGQFAILAAAVITGAVLGAYFGGAAVNHNHYNPAQWDWKSSRTYAGIFAGAAIGAASGAIGGAIALASPAAGIAAEVVLSAGENAAFTALGGGSRKEILESAAMGAATSAVLMGAAAGVSSAIARAASSGSRMARRGERAVLAESVDTAGEAPGIPCSSFPAGTLVATAEGLRPIEAVSAGAPVLAKEDETSNVVPFRVLATHTRDAAPLVEVIAGGTTVATTPEHPFWVVSRGWTKARALEGGDELLTADGRGVAVERVRSTGRTARVFNFTVEQAETYFVSPLRLLVHNVRGNCGVVTRARRREVIRSSGADPFAMRNDYRRLGRNAAVLRRHGPPALHMPGGRWVDFSEVRLGRRVYIQLTGNYDLDFLAADAAAGITARFRRQRSLVWHHVEGIVQTGPNTFHGWMELVPTRFHRRYRHYGAVSEYRGVPAHQGHGYGR